MVATSDNYQSASEPNTNNETFFKPEDVEEGTRLDGSESFRDYWANLELINRGPYFRYNNLKKVWNDRTHLYLNDNLGIFDGVASQLEMRPAEKEWGRRIFSGFKFKEHSVPGDRGMGIALSAFCVCSYIRWKNGGRTHPNHHNRDIDFKDVQSGLGFTDSQVTKRYGKVEYKIRRRGRGI